VDSFTITTGEAGQWTVALEDSGYYDLAYLATEQFGAAVDDPVVMHWDRELQAMTGDFRSTSGAGWSATKISRQDRVRRIEAVGRMKRGRGACRAAAGAG
jgi:hypothetical protein